MLPLSSLLLPVVGRRNIGVTPWGALRISGLVPRALSRSRLGVVGPGAGEFLRHAAFSLFEVADGVAEAGVAPTGVYGAGGGKDQLLAAVALERDLGGMPLVDLAKRDLAGLVARFDALDDLLRHSFTPSPPSSELTPEPSPKLPKVFGPEKPLLLGVGDRRPELQTLVVPQRQRLRLVVDLPLHRSLPPTRGTTTRSILYHTLLIPGRTAGGGSRRLRPSCPTQHL
jgi:hypothetical protein